MLEVEDIADKWDPPNSDGSCGTQQSERESERSKARATRTFCVPVLVSPT